MPGIIFSQIIQRAGDLPAHRFGECGVNLRRAHVGVAEELLHATDVDPPKHEMGRERMPQHMSGDTLAQSRQLRRTLQLARDGDLVQVVPPMQPFGHIFINAGRGEKPKPRPALCGLWVLHNWKATTNHSAADGLSSSSSILGVTALASLIGLGLSAFLLRAVYRALRLWLDRGIPADPRFRIPLSARLLPHPHLYLILIAFVFGFRHSDSGMDSGGAYSSEIVVGAVCSTAPLWLAALSITLWNVLSVLGRSDPDERVVHEESSSAHA